VSVVVSVNVRREPQTLKRPTLALECKIPSLTGDWLEIHCKNCIVFGIDSRRGAM
jgi:hypothetical protein